MLGRSACNVGEQLVEAGASKGEPVEAGTVSGHGLSTGLCGLNAKRKGMRRLGGSTVLRPVCLSGPKMPSGHVALLTAATR
jgi:hypothetical protein